MQSVLCIAAKLADDHRLLVRRAPGGYFEIRGNSFVPSDIFVDAENIQIGNYRIVKDLLVCFGRCSLIGGCSDQAGGIQSARGRNKFMQEHVTLGGLWCLIAYGPENDGRVVAI